MVPEALPPHRLISSTPIPLTTASTFLTTYITNSESHPHLHPDALITPGGVIFSSNGGPMGGVIMHNLRRVAAGLRGEYMEPEATPEPEEAEAEASDFKMKKSWKEKKHAGVAVDVVEGVTEGWQDLSEYEREAGVPDVGEIGERQHFVQSGGDAPAVEVHGAGGEVGMKRKAEGDKEARKKAKKAKHKAEQREKERKKAEEASKKKVDKVE